MTCGAVVTYCHVKGCGQALRRGQVDDHIANNQMRHFSLLEKDRENLLWEIMEKVTNFEFCRDIKLKVTTNHRLCLDITLITDP